MILIFTTKKRKQCLNFKGFDQDMSKSYKRELPISCKECVYFSSRNCGLDNADTIDFLDIFN